MLKRIWANWNIFREERCKDLRPWHQQRGRGCWLQGIVLEAGKSGEWKVGSETVKGCVEERMRNSNLDWRQQLVG